MRRLLLAATLLLPAAGRAQAPDFILTGGKILTGTRAHPTCRRWPCAAAAKWRVVAVSFSDAPAYLPQGYRVQDLAAEQQKGTLAPEPLSSK